MSEFTIPIPARLKNMAVNGHVAGTEDIIDDALGKTQKEINTETSEKIEEIKGGSTDSIASLKQSINNEKERAESAEEGLSNRLSDVEQLAEISLDGGEAKIATGEDFHNPTAEQRAKIPTVGAVLDDTDDEPTAGSDNLVKSGGVQKELALGAVYDVSAKNPTAGPNNDGKFESLSALLSDANLSTLIPIAVRKGGMSFKFVQSSDNKYMQYFLKSQSFTTDESAWEKVNLQEELKKSLLFPVNQGSVSTGVSGTYVTNTEVSFIQGHRYRITINFLQSGTFSVTPSFKLINQSSTTAIKKLIDFGNQYVSVGVHNYEFNWDDDTVEGYRTAFYGYNEDVTIFANAEVSIMDITSELAMSIIGKQIIPINYPGVYVKTSLDIGDIVNIEDVVVSASWNCCIISCKENDKIIVNGTGGASPRLWAFLDSDYKLLSVASANASAIDLELIVPQNTAYVVLNDGSNPHKVSYIVYAESISEIVGNVNEQEIIQDNERARLRIIESYNSLDEASPVIEQGLLLRVQGTPRFTSGSGSYPNYRYTPNYYPVQAGQIIHTNGYAAGDDAGIVYYDALKRVVGASDGSTTLDTDIVVPAGVSYVRFCTQSQTSSPLHIKIDAMRQWPDTVKIENEINRTVTVNNKKDVFLKGSQLIVGETAKSFFSKQKVNNLSYTGQLNPEKRYLAIGFDDFRDSDFAVIVPLFEKYGFRATFNKIVRASELDSVAQNQVNAILMGGHEMGDHTFLHYKFPFDEPMFNGQNPSDIDGSQIPFPSNSQLRDDRGDGKNVFGKTLTQTMEQAYPTAAWRPPIDSSKTWATLSDSDCQAIREFFSVMKDADSSLITMLDSLSNRYLGTTGNSVGSWDNTDGEYKNGIFTGCKTSANHEIWERYLQIMTLFYKEEMGINYDLKTWSLPGSKSSGCYFEDDGKYYYDSEFTKPKNNLAQFTSSLYKDQQNVNKVRCWTEVLREFGYNTTHDATYPGLNDGQTIPAMQLQNIFNARQSRPDNLIFPTNRSISYSAIENEFPESFFDSSAPIADQMYNAANSSLKKAIEAWRFWMCGGVIWGEVIDSADTYSERVFFETLLRYCKVAGIEVITKQEAYDICFNHRIRVGNLIYNPKLKNTAKEFMPNNSSVPTNPDGYRGNCSVTVDSDGKPVLEVNGNTTYYHFGVPTGATLKYTCKAKGSGEIAFKKILNKNSWGYGYISGAIDVTALNVSGNDFVEYEATFYIPDAPMTARDGLCEFYGNKIMGLAIVYNATIQVKDIKLICVDET